MSWRSSPSADRFGAVHGRGFCLGVDLVRDRTTRESATEETAAICDRMLELGVVIQPTGDRQNVLELKLKPPMVTTRESADYFVAALDRVLATGGGMPDRTDGDPAC